MTAAETIAVRMTLLALLGGLCLGVKPYQRGGQTQPRTKAAMSVVRLASSRTP